MEYLDKKVIVNEFLNNWFTIKELSDYLCIDYKKVEEALDSQNLLSSDYSDKQIMKIEQHKYYVNTTLSPDDINKDIGNYAAILEIADTFIANNLSIRQAAVLFEYSKSYLYDILTEELPKVSLYKYKQVFDILKANKSYGVNKKEVIEQVISCYKLLKMGLTEKEISNRLNIGENVVQRNLSYRLKEIDKDKYTEVELILRDNSINSLVPGNTINLDRERDSHGRFKS